MNSVSVNDRVCRIRENDKEINRFIEEYKPFIAACVEKSTGRYVRYGEDDELSIGMIAFAEAIRAFDGGKGNFLTFASNVIKRRLIDYYRKEKRHANVVSIQEYIREENEEADLSVAGSLDQYREEQAGEYRRLEIEQLQKALAEWDIAFSELVEASPRHAKTRRTSQEIIRFMLAQSDLLTGMRSRKCLPIAEIEKNLRIPRKRIERVRKYIIAVIIIMTGDYQYIRDYVDGWKWDARGEEG